MSGDRPLVEWLPLRAPGGRSASPNVELLIKTGSLAGLLAQIVELAGDSAIFPGHMQVLTEHAMEHHRGRAALLIAQANAS